VKEVIQQAANSVTSNPVGGATAITVSTGWATIMQYVPPFAGSCASVVGIYVTLYLFMQKKKINSLQIAKLEGKNETQ
jgi:cadmium resistance protein CadD (predicted permease)